MGIEIPNVHALGAGELQPVHAEHSVAGGNLDPSAGIQHRSRGNRCRI